MPSTVASQKEMIPGYRLIERLGAGGFGEVWKAEAPGGLLKAVKIVQGSIPDRMLDETRLKQELKALHRVKTIRHPFILSLERFDIIDGRLIIVSELADRTLADRFKECRSQEQPGIPRDELLGYMGETAEALDLMNEQFNLQHLDIKPQNIFLLFNHVKVGDFGLVKELEGMFAAITSGLTAVYAAPETFEGVVSRYSDQYNLAIAYQEMLTGKLPFDGTTGRQLMMQHMMGVPNLSPLPLTDQCVVARALSKKPEERFARCSEFVRALRQATGFVEKWTDDSAARAQTVAEKSEPAPTAFEEQPTSFLGPGCRPTPGSVSASVLPGDDPVFAAERTLTPERPSGQPSDLVEYVPPPPPPERPETAGNGVLLPALVVGLGGLGREVLQEFRKSLRRRGPSEAWPQIRLLNIDTDPQGYERATSEPDFALKADEILVSAFQRPSHYLKRQHERGELERWLPLNQLTKIARGQITAEGWRALGRLAFLSSGTMLSLRLRQELEACADEQALTDAARRTSLGLRTTRPCVYVVTSLAGGTGSGMFLDLAAAVRRELRQIGHPRAELIGVLLVPAVTRNAEARDVANGFAALTELKHFATGAQGSDSTGPFDRCVLLPLPAKAEGPTASQETISLAADYLCRELTTPLGRVADEGRKALEHSGAGLTCQTFGAYWFSVPRRPLLARVAQHLGNRLVRHWGIHDSNALTAAIHTWVTDQLTQANLTTETLTNRLEEECATVLGRPMNAWFAELKLRWGKDGAEDLGVGGVAVRKAMAELQELLGPPEREPDLALTSTVMTALQEGGRTVAESADGQLAELALGALSEPIFRLACIEEAVHKQLGMALDKAAQGQIHRSVEQRNQAADLWQQISPALAALHARGLFRGRARARAADTIRELLSQYTRARWGSALALTANRLFHNLLANLHRYRHEVGCCHKRINQFLKTFDSTTGAAQIDLGLGRYLLPFGCQTLEEAVARILDSLPPEEETGLHENVWKLIHATLHEHVHVCTASATLFRDLRERIDREVDLVAEDSLGRAHAAEMYLERQADYPDADADLAGAFHEAQPELRPGQRAPDREFTILAVPPGPEGERFRTLVRHALPDVPMRSAASTDDIVFYREQCIAGFDELPQLGAAAREQYAQTLATGPFGPHSRLDIAW